MPQIIKVYEKAIAGYLEKSLKGSKIRLWADAFTTNENARLKSQLFVGLQRVQYEDSVWTPEAGKLNRRKVLFFEIQALIYTLHNHQDALDLIDSAMTLLDGYQPYHEIEAIAPIRYGNARFNKADGSWIYTGECQSSLWASVAELTPIGEVIDPIIVQVGLFNVNAAEGNQSDRNWDLLPENP